MNVRLIFRLENADTNEIVVDQSRCTIAINDDDLSALLPVTEENVLDNRLMAPRHRVQDIVTALGHLVSRYVMVKLTDRSTI